MNTVFLVCRHHDGELGQAEKLVVKGVHSLIMLGCFRLRGIFYSVHREDGTCISTQLNQTDVSILDHNFHPGQQYESMKV